ncbi:TIGR03089 family protein [soil metagenome]
MTPEPASTTPEALFAGRLAADPGSPLITSYDDATGERAELSAKSVANWIAKTHFLLTDEVGAVPGQRVFVTLPVHWLAAPILFGAWFAGLEVVTDPASADVVFGDAPTLAGLELPDVDDIFAVSLLSMARSAEPPPGALDYAAAARPQPDNWNSVRAQATASLPALDGVSRSQLAVQAGELAAEAGLANAGRLLYSGAEFGAAAWLLALLAPLAVGGSTVLVRNPDPEKMAARVISEQVTVVR